MSTEKPTNSPEPPKPKWGDPISEERQAELQGILDAWNAPGADHGDKKGPFDKNPGEQFGVPLTDADVFWLAERVRNPLGQVPYLHLDGADLPQAHLEEADLRAARLEGTNLRAAHLERATLMEAHLEGATLSAAHLETLYVNPTGRATIFKSAG